MEADSTTFDSSTKTEIAEPGLPFNVCPGNFQLYKDFIDCKCDQRLECLLVERLKGFGLIPSSIKCLTNNADCKVVCRTARVIDRLQWLCESCGKRQPIRAGSFFFRLQCSLLKAMQIILAWSEDADIDVAAEYFSKFLRENPVLWDLGYPIIPPIINVVDRVVPNHYHPEALLSVIPFGCKSICEDLKPKVATLIYDRLDELAVKEQNKRKLGGENSVVLAEMYPDCVNRLSPDTTDQPHSHRILMLADTNHIPTSYYLHVLKDDNKKGNAEDPENEALKSEIEEVVRTFVKPNSLVVTGNNVPSIDGASTMQQLFQHCDVDMRHFLSSRIWRQAVTLCCASRSASAAAAQRYLTASLYRLRFADGLYTHILQAVAADYTDSGDS